MADNTVLNLGSGGDTSRSVQKGGATGPKSQVLVIDVSGAGAETLLSAANPMPMSAASLPLPTGAGTETTLAGVRTDLGTDGTTPPAVLGAGTGVRGWLRSIYEKLTGTLAVTGTFFQATQPVSIAANTPDVTDRAARLLGVVASITGALPAGTNSIGTTTGPALTKGTQAAAGYSTQDLKDAGRVSFSASTVIAGVTAVTVEALLSLVPVRDGTAAAAATSFAVTAGKRLRLQVAIGGLTSTAAAVISCRIVLRMSTTGVITATSPIISVIDLHSPGAVAQQGETLAIPIPDGFEFSGTQQFGLTHVANVASGTIRATLMAFEY